MSRASEITRNPYESEDWESLGNETGGAMRPGGTELTNELLERAGISGSRERSYASFPSNVRSMLDIACGTGETTAMLQSLGIRVLGIDSSPKLVAEARARHPEVRFEMVELQECPGMFETFDAAIAQCSISEIAAENGIANALASCASCIKPGGMFLFSDVYDKGGKSPWGLPSYDGWLSEMEKTGFDAVWHDDKSSTLSDFVISLIWAGFDIKTAGSWCPAIEGVDSKNVGYMACVMRKRL